jgi:hypothetical protein
MGREIIKTCLELELNIKDYFLNVRIKISGTYSGRSGRAREFSLRDHA